jgi:hypothetical protein
MQVIPFSHRNISISFREFVRKIKEQEKNNQNAGQALKKFREALVQATTNDPAEAKAGRTILRVLVI